MKVQWISSKERLPEMNVAVLVFLPEEDEHITTGMWDVSKKWVLLDEYRVPTAQVTYWAEMVEKPDDRTYERTYNDIQARKEFYEKEFNKKAYEQALIILVEKDDEISGLRALNKSLTTALNYYKHVLPALPQKQDGTI